MQEGAAPQPQVQVQQQVPRSAEVMIPAIWVPAILAPFLLGMAAVWAAWGRSTRKKDLEIAQVRAEKDALEGEKDDLEREYREYVEKAAASVRRASDLLMTMKRHADRRSQRLRGDESMEVPAARPVPQRPRAEKKDRLREELAALDGVTSAFRLEDLGIETEDGSDPLPG